MEDREIMQEIEELRMQLQALSSARGAAASPGPTTQQEVAGEGGEAGFSFRDIIRQAEELIGDLDLHLKDVPAKTALVIFALGVLTGRLLSRRG